MDNIVVKIDMNCYCFLLEFYNELKKKNEFSLVKAIDKIGVRAFLEFVRNHDVEETRKIDALFAEPSNIIYIRAITYTNFDAEKAKADLKRRVLYFPKVDYEEKAFNKVIMFFSKAYFDNPNLFHELEEEGLVKTINKLVEKYNLPKKNENQA